MNQRDVHGEVATYYGETLQSSNDLKTNACCAFAAPPAHIREALTHIHDDVTNRFYGCGFPVPEALEGAHAADLGCGTGRDVYLLSQLVGRHGHVHGVDMTEKQLAVARDTQAWHAERFGFGNVTFHEGRIESLDMFGDDALDLIVSNCVVNLSPDKAQVMREAARVLKPGGEFYLSDVLCDRRLPEDVVRDEVLYGECLGGAMYDADFLSLCRRTGFLDPRIVETAPIEIHDDAVVAKVGTATFTSVTLRLFYLPQLEERCEDYGQVATYLGTMPEAPHRFVLDDHHVFDAGRPERVCGNTAMMLSDTRFGRHFRIDGDRSTHFGAFPCGSTLAMGPAVGGSAPKAEAPSTGCC